MCIISLLKKILINKNKLYIEKYIKYLLVILNDVGYIL